MTQISVNLALENDSSVRIHVEADGRQWAHVAGAHDVSALRQDVDALMTSLEGGRLPLADPVRLVELGGQLRDVYLKPLYADEETRPLAAPEGRLLFTAQEASCLDLPCELLPGVDGNFLVGERQRWAAVRLAQRLQRMAEFRTALDLLEPLLEEDRHHELLHETASALQSLGDWQEARKRYQEALPLRQAIGDRKGEAATWHQLATIDLNEGHYAEAREKFGKALSMRQAIGDRAGEAGSFHQIGFVAWETGHREVGMRLVALAHGLLTAIGNADKDRAQEALCGMAAELGLDQPGFHAILQEAAEYRERVVRISLSALRDLARNRAVDSSAALIGPM